MNDSHEIAEKVKQRTPKSHVGEFCEAMLVAWAVKVAGPKHKLWGLGNSTIPLRGHSDNNTQSCHLPSLNLLESKRSIVPSSLDSNN
jgi:hypothetical protein